MARQLVIDHRTADLDDADMALCDYAVKLTLDPGATGAPDVERLREHGFDDEAILIATQVISYFNYINRMADALGVDDETWMTPPRADWLTTKGTGYSAAK